MTNLLETRDNWAHTLICISYMKLFDANLEPQKYEMSFGLTGSRLDCQVTVVDSVQDVVQVSLLPDEAANVFLFVQAVKEKAGFNRALLGSFLHEGDVALGVFAAGDHAVPVSVQIGRRQERRSVFHRFVRVEDKVLLAFLEALQALLTGLLAPSVV